MSIFAKIYQLWLKGADHQVARIREQIARGTYPLF